MIVTKTLGPGITLRCCQDKRFKTNCLSLRFVTAMTPETSAANALIPAVLLRGTRHYPDLQAITRKLDDLYGAAAGARLYQVGDWQTTGLYLSFAQDRFAMDGDSILEPVVDFLEELLLRPRLEDGIFCREFVESEKKNALSSIAALKNDKRSYASAQMLKIMGSSDPIGLPRQGEPEAVAALTAESLYRQYEVLLRESRIDLFYVGAQSSEYAASLLTPVFEKLDRSYVNLPAQTPFHDGGESRREEVMDVAQAKLQMGFLTPITTRDRDFPTMQMLNMVLGGGMTSKLFMVIREKMSLCYDIGSSYLGSKGILTVAAGMDRDMAQTVEEGVLRQLDAICREEISPAELQSAREGLLSSLRTVRDSAGAIENFFETAALNGMPFSLEGYREAIRQVSVQDVARVARSLKKHTVYLLRGDA